MDLKYEENPESLRRRSRSIRSRDDKPSVYSTGFTRTVDLGELEDDVELQEKVNNRNVDVHRTESRDE